MDLLTKRYFSGYLDCRKKIKDAILESIKKNRIKNKSDYSPENCCIMYEKILTDIERALK